MYCKHCGKPISSEAKFCPECGGLVVLEKDANPKGNPETGEETEPLHDHSEDRKRYLFIGTNQEYFFRKWKNDGGWNWAAFFFGPLWLGYRKMYKYVFILLIIYLCTNIGLNSMAEEDAQELAGLINLAIAALFGVMSNKLYKNHMEQKIRKIESETEPGEEQMLRIEKAGGVEGFGILLAFLVIIVYVVIVSSLL